MRIIIFFDLPTLTQKDIIEYRNFRKFLLKSGFIMMQESVYCKLALNGNSCDLIKEQVCKNLPSVGLVQMLVVTEKQFAEIEYLRGEVQTNTIHSSDRIIKL